MLELYLIQRLCIKKRRNYELKIKKKVYFCSEETLKKWVQRIEK
jgi:hypothetical protein